MTDRASSRAQWAILALLAGSIAALHRGQRDIARQIARSTDRTEKTMGVVATTLKQIDDQLKKAHGEIVDRVESLLARETLDDDDRAALEAIRGTAQSLDDVVPDAVTEPLPDPEEAPAADGGETVVDPADPLPAVEEEVAAPVADNAPTVGDGEVIDNSDGGALTGENSTAASGDPEVPVSGTEETDPAAAESTGDAGAADDETPA